MDSTRRPLIDVDRWPVEAPWKRQSGESEEGWMAFFTYLCLPFDQRTILGAYREFTGEIDAERAAKNWELWAAKNRWNERSVAFERWKRAKEQVVAEQRQAEENEKWEKIRNEERERLMKMGQALLEKAQAMLAFPLAEVERVVSVYPDGSPKEVQIFKPAGWNFGTVARMVEVGGKLVQLMSNMATERHQVDLSIIYDEADRVAREIGVTRDDVLEMADRIVREREEQLEQEGRI